MGKPLIKICGLSEADAAAEIVLAGADFIGLVFHPPSKRHVTLEKAKKIAAAVQASGGAVVGVFVNQGASEILATCLALNMNIVQLHGTTAKEEHHLLADHFQRIYVQPVRADGHIEINFDQSLLHCRPERDFLLFDNEQPGSGRPFHWDTFKTERRFRIGLAGGLTPENVSRALQTINPDLIDVSSGVEKVDGQKDIAKVLQLIQTIRGHYENCC